MERGPIRLLLLAVAVAPLVEEIYFRGFLYNSLRAVCPAWIAVFLQALLFGLGHVDEPLGVIVTFVIGLLFAAIYEWRKTLLATVFVHGIYNLIVMGAFVAVVMANRRRADDWRGVSSARRKDHDGRQRAAGQSGGKGRYSAG